MIDAAFTELSFVLKRKSPIYRREIGSEMVIDPLICSALVLWLYEMPKTNLA
jgi:hypothetical protein